MDEKQELLRALPKVDEMLQCEQLVFLLEEQPRAVVVEAVREVIEKLRKEILCGERSAPAEEAEIILAVLSQCGKREKRSLIRVVNAAGVVLHTNLGRAPLCERAIDRAAEAAGSYSNLEYDVKLGMRGSRHSHVEKLITRITGAEAVMVVNNNAAATMLCLSAMARGREVIVSRGELVEIGGSFRIPEIMEQSGAVLREVGTTNKTKAADYRNAYREDVTGALMKVHTSNYRIVGFTQDVSLKELSALKEELSLPVIYDMGGGLMTDLSGWGLDEPTVQDAVRDGADVVLFSGDKLLGGPQGGVIIGKRQYVDRMKSHPLARAFRIDKMTLAAMEATFFEYLDPERVRKRLPVLSMITEPAETMRGRAERLCALLCRRTSQFTFAVEECQDQVGGGSAPTVLLKGYAVTARSETISPERAERLLRKAKVPVIGRIAHDRIWLHVRTVAERDLELVGAAFQWDSSDEEQKQKNQ